MYTSGEDRTEHDPQEGRRTVENTHDGTEDWTQTRDIQELHQKNTPRSHRNKVHSVCLRQCRCLTIRLNPEDLFYQYTVGQKTYY